MAKFIIVATLLGCTIYGGFVALGAVQKITASQSDRAAQIEAIMGR